MFKMEIVEKKGTSSCRRLLCCHRRSIQFFDRGRKCDFLATVSITV